MTGVRLARDIPQDLPTQHAFEVEALLNVRERKGLLAKTDVLGEIKRLRGAAPAPG